MKMGIRSGSDPFVNAGTQWRWVIQVSDVAYLCLAMFDPSHLFYKLLISSTKSCLGSAMFKFSLFVM